MWYIKTKKGKVDKGKVKERKAGSHSLWHILTTGC